MDCDGSTLGAGSSRLSTNGQRPSTERCCSRTNRTVRTGCLSPSTFRRSRPGSHINELQADMHKALSGLARPARVRLRRRFHRVAGIALASALGAGALVVSPDPSTAAGSRDYFAVPEAALVRSLGEVSPGTCAPLPASQACQGNAEP